MGDTITPTVTLSNPATTTLTIPPAATDNSQNVVPGVTRRSTASALDRLSRATGKHSTAFSAWYEPGLDYCFYVAADTAFKTTEAGLKKLKLTPAERKTLATSRSLDVIVQRMTAVQSAYNKAHEDSVLTTRVARLTNAFCGFATRVSGIVNILIPQSPEYTITFGLLEIVFKAVVDKKEKQQALADFVETVTAQLPLAEFYESIFPTNAMKSTASALYVEVITFLEAAARYYCTGRFTKFIDAILQPIETQFDGYMSSIGDQTNRMKDLAHAAHVAQTSDMQKVVDDTGFVISRIYENLEGAVSALGSSIALVNQKVENLSLNQTYITSFHAKSYVQALRQEAFSGVPSASSTLDRLAAHTFDLSPKDHWDQNGVLAYFSRWSDTGRQATFWVGGRSGNQETWVTEMSVDLIRALESQDKIAVYVFCAGTLDGEPVTTPSVLARAIIVQLLEAFPLSAFHNPEILNARKLGRATSFTQLWAVVRMLAELSGEVFLVIDRVDQCKAETAAGVEDVLLPALAELTKSCTQVSVILTADREPPASLQANEDLDSVWISTAVAPHIRNNRRD